MCMETKVKFYKKYFYKDKKENKVRKDITIHESVWDSVAERQAEFGGSVSPLIENLLCSWCFNYDKLNHPEKIKALEKQEKEIKKRQSQDVKKQV